MRINSLIKDRLGSLVMILLPRLQERDAKAFG
jgi:hypothetical protein